MSAKHDPTCANFSAAAADGLSPGASPSSLSSPSGFPLDVCAASSAGTADVSFVNSTGVGSDHDAVMSNADIYTSKLANNAASVTDITDCSAATIITLAMAAAPASASVANPNSSRIAKSSTRAGSGRVVKAPRTTRAISSHSPRLLVHSQASRTSAKGQSVIDPKVDAEVKRAADILVAAVLLALTGNETALPSYAAASADGDILPDAVISSVAPISVPPSTVVKPRLLTNGRHAIEAALEAYPEPLSCYDRGFHKGLLEGFASEKAKCDAQGHITSPELLPVTSAQPASASHRKHGTPTAPSFNSLEQALEQLNGGNNRACIRGLYIAGRIRINNRFCSVRKGYCEGCRKRGDTCWIADKDPIESAWDKCGGCIERRIRCSEAVQTTKK